MDNWQQQADQLLKESDLLAVLKRFGQPEFTGSYLYELMSNGDIDIYLVTNRDTRQVAQKLLRRLVEQGWWNGYMLYDWVHWHRDYMLKGYYVGTKTDFADNRWKVDIWVLNEFPLAQKSYNEKLTKQLNPENRLLILKIKQEREIKGWPVDGKTIYDAVLTAQIKTVAEFKLRFKLK